MGTRGLYGIRKNGIDKAAYNHYDSYPDWLGKKVVEFCASNNADKLEKFFDSIELVDEGSTPMHEQIEYCIAHGYFDEAVSTGSKEDWYCLLRNLQGNFDAYQDCIDNDRKVYMTDGICFIEDSLFCEYAYVINPDDNVLEFYVGFQKQPQEGNRYGTEDDSGYYPCKMVKAFPLDYLYGGDDSFVEYIVDTMQKIEEEQGN